MEVTVSEEKEQLDKRLLDAINLLKNAVKESHVKHHRHIDLTIPMAHERPEYEKALALARSYVAAGKIDDKDLKKRLGLI